MNWSDPLPPPASLQPPALILLEAEPGQARTQRLEDWLRQARAQGATGWLLPCDFDEGGPWAGLRELLGALVPSLRERAPELLTRHDYELLTVLPTLRREMEVRYPTLTDAAFGDEKVRNYPYDRAFRIVQGLVDMMEAWHARSGGGRWVLACDCFDKAGALTRRFLLELMRRRGARLQLSLVLAVAPGAGESVAAALPARAASVHPVRLALPAESSTPLPAEQLAQRAEQLEQQMGRDLIEYEMNLPRLIRLYRQAGQARKARWCLVLAFGQANHYGLYEDALRYGDMLRGELEQLKQEDPNGYWVTIGNYFNGYLATRQADKALALAQWLEPLLEDPNQRLRLDYILGMLHARYLVPVDLKRAEDYLDRGLAHLEKADLPEDQKYFLHVFNRNGLALVRHRQGRPHEAVELCRRGAQELDARLGPQRHRLHRSVLQYNMAQVYAAIGALEEAYVQYSAAIEMDPNYSEYFNERGSVLMRMGRLDKALEDLRHAQELSPPYPEVRINLGQCLRQMGRLEEAYEAYSAALDLEPQRVLALVNRAQVAEALGRSEQALADYTEALRLEPSQPLVLANRAALLYSANQSQVALEDLERALALLPDMADLHQNYATVLGDLGRTREAAQALRNYLRLAPQAPDRAEVEAQLRSLEVSA